MTTPLDTLLALLESFPEGLRASSTDSAHFELICESKPTTEYFWLDVGIMLEQHYLANPRTFGKQLGRLQAVLLLAEAAKDAERQLRELRTLKANLDTE